MKCPNCKMDNPAGERFCWRCHLPLEEGRLQWAGHAAVVKGRRRMLRLLLALAVVAALAFAILQITYRRSPAGVVAAFTKARERLDFRTMYLLLSRDSQKTVGVKGVRDIWPAQPNVRYKFGVLDWRAKGDEAAVQVAIQKEATAPEGEAAAAGGVEHQLIRLQKEEGRWRINVPGPEEE